MRFSPSSNAWASSRYNTFNAWIYYGSIGYAYYYYFYYAFQAIAAVLCELSESED